MKANLVRYFFVTQIVWSIKYTPQLGTCAALLSLAIFGNIPIRKCFEKYYQAPSY